MHTVAVPAPSASAAEEEKVHFAVCAASAETQTPVVLSVGDASRPFCNFVSHALRILTPGLESNTTPITVLCKRGLKDLCTLPREAQQRFVTAVGKEFPRGEKLCGVVLDLIVNNNNWKNNPYLYACILGRNANVQCQRDTSFLMSMELLLYTCANMVAADAQFLEECRIFFENQTCTCSVAWKLHRYDISSDGSVARKIESAVGRIDYHIVVSVPHNSGFMHHDVGHVYHATDWKQNTYHPTGPLPPCTRALVVSGHDALVLALRTAFASSWLALSGHQSVYCVLPRIRSPSVPASGDLTPEDASGGSSSCPWKFPSLPEPETVENSRRTVRSIIRQCELVCSKSSGEQEKTKILRRLVFAWHPDNAILMNRDHAVCAVVSQWLQKLQSCFSDY